MVFHEKPGALLVRDELQPGESLPSLFSRLVEINGYGETAPLMGVIKNPAPSLSPQASISNLLVARSPGVFERLAALTTLPIEDLYAATAHRFAPTLVPPGEDGDDIYLPGVGTFPGLPQGIISRHTRDRNAAQYCPQCLREAPYHRVLWAPLAVSACLEHNCLLAVGCPKCGNKIGIADLTAATCPYCQTDLRDTETLDLKGDDFGLYSQRVLQGWLIQKKHSGVETSGYGAFPDQPFDVLYRVAFGLRIASQVAGVWWPYLHRPVIEHYELPLAFAESRPSPLESYILFATALKGIAGWPESFHAFLAAYRRQRNPGSGYNTTILTTLGTLYTRWIDGDWRRPPYSWLQEECERYLMANYTATSWLSRTGRYRDRPNAVHQFSLTRLPEAARMLGIRGERVKLLIDRGILSKVAPDENTPEPKQTTATASGDAAIYVRRAEVEALAFRWKDLSSNEHTAEKLGISPKKIPDLIEAGLLQAERGPSVDGSALTLFTSGAIDACLEQFRAHTSPLDGNVEPDDYVDVGNAAYMLKGNAQSTIGLLKAVAEGRVTAYLEAGAPLRIDSLRFKREDLKAYIARHMSDSGWVTRDDFAKRMGVKVTVVYKWVYLGLIAPVTKGYTKYFDAGAVERFIKDHIFGDEAASILGIGELALYAWVRKGRLVPVAGPTVEGPGADRCGRYLFRRADVERLSKGNRLTAPQLARRVGISRSQMHHRIKQGLVKPVSGPGIDGARHYLFSLPLDGPDTSSQDE